MFVRIFLLIIIIAIIGFTNFNISSVPGQYQHLLYSSVNLLSLAFLIFIYGLSKSLRREIFLLKRNNEKLSLSISDYSKESSVLTALNGIIEVFGKNPNLEEILNKIADSAVKLLKVKYLVLQVYSTDEQKFFTQIVRGEKNFELSEDIIEDIILQGNSALINNLDNFPRYRNFARNGYTSLLIAPLKVREESIGLIAALSKEKRTFSGKDLNLLTMIAVQASLIIENIHLSEKTKLLSITDGLTNLFNHRHFHEKITQELNDAKKNNSPLSLVMADVDYFKEYNDLNGHPAGDEVLRQVAKIFMDGTKGSDTVARYGGDEFVFIFPNTLKKNAFRLCQRLNKKIKNFKFVKEKEQPNKDLTVSMGVATFPDDASTAEALIKKADTALYHAKEQGKDRVAII